MQCDILNFMSTTIRNYVLSCRLLTVENWNELVQWDLCWTKHSYKKCPLISLMNYMICPIWSNKVDASNLFSVDFLIVPENKYDSINHSNFVLFMDHICHAFQFLCQNTLLVILDLTMTLYSCQRSYYFCHCPADWNATIYVIEIQQQIENNDPITYISM